MVSSKRITVLDKEKLALLERVPEPALNRAARTLLDLRETWESTAKGERKDLVHIMIQEVGVDVAIKRVQWVKARPAGTERFLAQTFGSFTRVFRLAMLPSKLL